MGNFWANRLGTPGPAAPRQAPHQSALPNGMGQNHDASINHYMEGRQFAPQQPQWTGTRQPEPDYSGGPPVDENGMIYYLDGVKAWKGSRRAQEETASTGSCPGCGSNKYFSLRSESKTTANGMASPRPHCFECGYPNEQGALGISAKATGAAAPSRQGASPSMALAATMS